MVSGSQSRDSTKEDTMIILGRVSQQTRGTSPKLNWSEDQRICVEGNLFYLQGCEA